MSMLDLGKLLLDNYPNVEFSDEEAASLRQQFPRKSIFQIITQLKNDARVAREQEKGK
jgi:hypothetical protein